MIVITPDDIALAERILLSKDHHFDEDERIPFIQRFDTVDVQAVPGSGKTTALLAKLIVLEKNLPFVDGSGILVLSHTNTAVEKIEKEIKRYCPKLFSYPNYVGTIQGFVNKFLAIPFYRNCYKKSPVLFDSELYKEKIIKWFSIHTWKIKSSNSALYKKLYHIKMNYDPFVPMRFGYINNDFVLLDSMNGELLNFRKPKPKSKNYKDYTEEEKLELYNWAINLKKTVLTNEGILHYDDAFFLANTFIDKYPSTLSEIQLRFKYVFVDEMQDMKKHQIDILERLFLKDDISSCYQRIGDINQTIYGDDDFDENVSWNSVKRQGIKLTGTHRLTTITANIVEKFGIIYTPINSQEKHYNECPKLILYREANLKKVLPLFAKYVAEHKGKYPALHNGKYPIKAIGWTRANDKGVTLSSYFEGYHSLDSFRKNVGTSIWADLQESLKDTNENGLALRYIENVIWKGFVMALKKENYNKCDLTSSVDKLQYYLLLNQKDFFNRIKEHVYLWSIDIMEVGLDKAHMEIKEFVTKDFLASFGLTFKYSKDYFENKVFIPDAVMNQKHNIYTDPDTGIEFEVTTIHSVKGETHLATLYLETYFQNDGGREKKSYESQRLLEQLRGIQIDPNIDKKRTKQSSKMVYVGFSRPRYLLCYAANVKHFSEADLIELNKLGWEIKKDLC